MLDVATADGDDAELADLAVFVDRLAEAGKDRGTALAHAQVRRAVAAGTPPPGLRRLAEALAASVTELPPPRRPGDEAVSLVEVMRATALAVLDTVDPAVVATAVGALVGAGHRVIVTAADPAALSAVRDGLPPGLDGHALDRIPALAPAELRELRRLLATSTPARRARAGQELPPDPALPATAEVTALCALANRPAADPAPELAVLAGLEPARRAAVVELAEAVCAALAELPDPVEHPWSMRLLDELVHNVRHAAVDDLVAEATGALRALDRGRAQAPVVLIGRMPEQPIPMLRRYLEFLESGGRTRTYFPPAAQREVRPVLGAATVDGHRPESAADVRRLIEHLIIGAALRRVDGHCAELGLPAPRSEAELVSLTERVAAVAAAARAVGALRHDVLFLDPDSPLPVPDVPGTRRVATAIRTAAVRVEESAAATRLDRWADELADRVPPPALSPEHGRAVAALRERDAAGYTAALTGLAVARREVRDQRRCQDLLATLSQAAPRLAAAWSAAPTEDRPGFGLAAFVTVERLLSALPPPDSADVVVVHGAAGLGMERLLLAAVAPRLVATAEPDDLRADGPSLLSVLRRAAAPVIRAPVAATTRADGAA